MKRRLIRESISEEQQEKYLDMFASIPPDERKRIRQTIKECLKKYGFAVGLTGAFALLGIMVLTIGIKFKSPETIVAGFAMLATGGTTIGIAERKSILLCAAKKLGMDLSDMLNKMRSVEEESAEITKESTMKKTIRLTESELVKLVQKIIKEDEMMDTETTSPSLGDMAPYAKLVSASMRDLLSGSNNISWKDKSTNNDFEYYSKHKYIFTVRSGQVYGKSPGGPSPIRRLNNIDKVIYMNKAGGTAEIEFIEKDGSRGDSYTLTCRNGKITISSISTVGP
jgi:hypothetical protein